MKVKCAILDGYNEPGRCFFNVAKLVRDKGGKAVFGWLVTTLEDIESRIHHCVWQQPDGELVDVTPQFDPDATSHFGAEMVSLGTEVEFEPDESATLVDGITRVPVFKPTQPKFAKFVELMARSEEAFWRKDVAGVNYWAERADKERHKVHGKNPKHQKSTIHMLPGDEEIRFDPLRPELAQYLS